VGSLLPALDWSLDVNLSLRGLSDEVRTEPFTTRFQRTVLEQLPLDGQRWAQVA
jgi:hypothetical protein